MPSKKVRSKQNNARNRMKKKEAKARKNAGGDKGTLMKSCPENHVIIAGSAFPERLDFQNMVVGFHDAEIQYLVKTCRSLHEKVDTIVDKLEKIKTNILQYSEKELSHHHAESTPEFHNWCDDIAIYYIHRFVLTGEVIPVASIDEILGGGAKMDGMPFGVDGPLCAQPGFK